VISDRVRERLAIIAGRVPDGDEGSTEPLLAAWGDVRISMEDADELLASIEAADWLVELLEQHGQKRAWALLRTYIRLLAVPATMETLQMMQERATND
jgi:hypothetical protein